MTSYPKDAPRSVEDTDKDDYDRMIRDHRAQQGTSAQVVPPARRETPPPVIEKLNFAREAREKWESGRHAEAMLDGLSGVADLTVAGSALRGLLRGEIKVDGPHKWRTKPWEEGRGARQWMGDKGTLNPGQHGHHGLIPNNGWGKPVPDAVKHQPWNIKGMPDAETHGRIHGNYKGKPQFDPIRRYWYGTPTWWKAANASALTHGGSAALDALDEAIAGKKR